MKKLFSLLLVASVGLTAGFSQQKDSTGLPGDHFDLKAVLEVFKKSSSLESFEKALNSEESKVNNLDLNSDGKIDYIRVIDHKDSSVHAIVLQALISSTESHDVAVIEIEKKGKEFAQVQVSGNEELYGKDYFVEPKEEKDNKSPNQDIIIVNVWYWPCVQFIYAPVYVVWISPWYWDYYPFWWHPWYPVHWYVYYGWVSPCHAHYYVVHHRRSELAYTVYQPHRTYSATVKAKRINAEPRKDNTIKTERKEKPVIKEREKQIYKQPDRTKTPPKTERPAGGKKPGGERPKNTPPKQTGGKVKTPTGKRK